MMLIAEKQAAMHTARARLEFEGGMGGRTADAAGCSREQAPSAAARVSHVHYVVSIRQLASLGMIEFVARRSNASVTPIIAHELEAGAIAQVLINPDLILVYNDFLEPSWGVAPDFIEAQSFLPLHTHVTFSYIRHRVHELLGAVALGVCYLDSDGPSSKARHTVKHKVLLAPQMDVPLILTEGDMIAVLVRAQGPTHKQT
jgi:hypothetical protein